MRDEIEVLKEIFSTEEDGVLKLNADNEGGTFFIHAIPPEIPYIVRYPEARKKTKGNSCDIRDHSCEIRPHGEAVPSVSSQEEPSTDTTHDEPITHSFSIEHLKPFELVFEFVNGYPERECPKFLLKCCWLSKLDLSRLCHRLQEMWSTNRSEILYAWVMFLQGESLEYLDYSSSLDLTSVVRWNHTCNGCKCAPKPWTKQCTRNNDPRAHVVKSGYAIIGDLQQYNMRRRDYLFDREMFSCNICLEYELGSNCVKLNCGHINCRKCVEKFVDQLVKEGDFASIRCPDELCRTELTMDVVNSLGSSRLTRNYMDLKLVTDLQAQGLLVYCPRKFCMRPTAADPQLNLALCSKCKLAFCTLCKCTYHGINPCKLFKNDKERRRILEQYQNGDKETRAQLDLLYGRNTLERAIEEMMSEQEIANIAKPCPHCKSHIEKFEGCNKVLCANCHQYFCWICSEVLDRGAPYGHFSNPQSECYRKLFQGVYDLNNDVDGNAINEDDFIIEFIG